MSFFTYFTPASYLLLVVLWLAILLFYAKKIHEKRLKSGFYLTLLSILAIDAFRTLFESVYFGFWYSSVVGFIPQSVHDLLVRPENVFIPKAINVIAAVLIIMILLLRWLPEEEAEREKEATYLRELEEEVRQRKEAEADREKLIAELQQALAEVKILQGIIPICSYCKKIRDDNGFWEQVETYVGSQTDAEFSHGICPDCVEIAKKDMGLPEDEKL